METPINIVLVEPEIPHNTGAVGRLCVGLGARLHLVEPLGFSIDETAVRRSGLDYWEHVDLHVHGSWEAFLRNEAPGQLLFASTRGTRDLYTLTPGPGTYLVFGNESRGLPSGFYEQYAGSLFRIPMPGRHARSINLSNSVAIAAYEVYRQFTCKGSGES